MAPQSQHSIGGWRTSQCDDCHCWLCDVRRQGSTTQSEDLAASGAQQLCAALLAAGCSQQCYVQEAPSWQSGNLFAEPASHFDGSQPEHRMASASAQMINGAGPGIISQRKCARHNRLVAIDLLYPQSSSLLITCRMDCESAGFLPALLIGLRTVTHV